MKRPRATRPNNWLLRQFQRVTRPWLRGRRFSVSKVAIALGDYLVGLWGGVLVYLLVRREDASVASDALSWAIPVFVIYTAVMALGMLVGSFNEDN